MFSWNSVVSGLKRQVCRRSGRRHRLSLGCSWVFWFFSKTLLQLEDDLWFWMLSMFHCSKQQISSDKIPKKTKTIILNWSISTECQFKLTTFFQISRLQTIIVESEGFGEISWQDVFFYLSEIKKRQSLSKMSSIFF